MLRPAQRANVRVAIGETASRLGREDLAREQFGRFVAEFPRDNRRRWVLDRLAALSAEEARPAASPESR